MPNVRQIPGGGLRTGGFDGPTQGNDGFEVDGETLGPADVPGWLEKHAGPGDSVGLHVVGTWARGETQPKRAGGHWCPPYGLRLRQQDPGANPQKVSRADVFEHREGHG
mgnify:CR=1 FL=1